MENYKKIIYDNYLKYHNKQSYGANFFDKGKTFIPSLKYYYGKHLPNDKNARIIDLGCGDGNFIYFLNKMGYSNTSGVDVSSQEIEIGTKLGIKNLTCSDIFSFLENNNTHYDVIIAKDVMEHFTKDEVFEFLKLVRKNLVTGGILILQVPNGQGLFYTSIFYGDFTHEVAYTEKSINQISLNTGFSESKCFELGPAPVSLISKIRYILWKIVVFRFKLLKMIETGSPKAIFSQNLIAVLKN